MMYQGLKLKRTWVEINLDNLKFNLSQIKKCLNPNCKIMGIVKADAYGHGDKIIADHLIDYGVDSLGVSNIEEALSLRRFGVKIPILVLGYTPPSLVNILSQYNITQTIYNLEYAKKISNVAQKQNILVSCHVKIDTGMNRIGFKPFDENFEFNQLLAVYKLPALNISGIFTHFAVSDENKLESEEYTNKQFTIFKKVCDDLTKHGINVGIRHCCNSAATVKYPQMHLDMVRPGILLYGPYIDSEMTFKPIMQLKTKVSMVKNISPGETVGYGRTFTAEKPMKIATICSGYADGLNRLFSNMINVSLKNKPCKLIGSICMDQAMIDVTEIKDVQENDDVILWGNEICNLNILSKNINTIPYELLCNISKRVPRLYIKNNKEYTFIDYIASI